jgi:hypothetical protein
MAPAAVAGPLAVLLPFIELACAAALIPVGTAWWGGTGVLTMLIAFTAAIGISPSRPDARLSLLRPAEFETYRLDHAGAQRGANELVEGETKLFVGSHGWAVTYTHLAQAVLCTDG